MARKKCSVGREDYEEGSFSDVIHRYIEAATDNDLSAIKNEIIQHRLQDLKQWSRGVLSEFIPHFAERFKNATVESNSAKLDIDKWNWMGLILGQLQAYKWAVELYKALYALLCDLQEEKKGRIHKGLPLHQIGWVHLLQGTPESIKASQYYMKLAMLEDKIKSGDDNRYKTWPAFSVLTSEHKLTESYLDRIAGAVKDYKQKYPDDIYLRPELIYLEYVIDRKNQERSNL